MDVRDDDIFVGPIPTFYLPCIKLTDHRSFVMRTINYSGTEMALTSFGEWLYCREAKLPFARAPRQSSEAMPHDCLVS